MGKSGCGFVCPKLKFPICVENWMDCSVLISEAFVFNFCLERLYSVNDFYIKRKHSISAHYIHYLCVVSASRAPTLSAGLVGHKTSPAIVRPVEGHNRAAPLLSAQDKLQ